jgi:hypothetical protein
VCIFAYSSRAETDLNQTWHAYALKSQISLRKDRPLKSGLVSKRVEGVLCILNTKYNTKCRQELFRLLSTKRIEGKKP